MTENNNHPKKSNKAEDVKQIQSNSDDIKFKELYRQDNIEDILRNKEDLEKLIDRIEKKNESKWEKVFIPAMIVFSLIAALGYYVIYSITQDMRTLAKAMDPKMEYHMSVMADSVKSMSIHVKKMTKSVDKMNENIGLISQDFSSVAKNMNGITKNIHEMNLEIKALTPMVKNIYDMNKILLHIEKSVQRMSIDFNRLGNNIDQPMSVINSMPFF